MGSADGAGVVLEPDDLGASLAETEVSAGHHDGILGIGVADDALLLRVADIRGFVADAENLAGVEDGLVVQQHLLDHLQFIILLPLRFEAAVGVLHLLLNGPAISFWEVGLDSDHYRVVVILLRNQLVLLVLKQIKLANAFGELLLQTRTELVGLGQRVLVLVRVEAGELVGERLTTEGSWAPGGTRSRTSRP